jgi:hypothetical protein
MYEEHMGADCDSESRRKRAYVAALKRRNVVSTHVGAQRF